MTRVAFQGERGAFGEEAVLGWFGESAEPVPMATFSAVCASVERGQVDAGVLPLENSLAGTVGDALDALADGTLRVVGEVLLPIRHQLLARDGVTIDAVRRVRSHWQALAQCDRFLSEHGWELIPAADTAGAARELATAADSSTAVIASRRAAALYGLSVVAEDIQGAAHNLTRFAVLVPDDGTVAVQGTGPLAPRGGVRETLVTFETGHRPGDLYRALGTLAEAGVNLSRIESRPSGDGPWRYRFLIQVAGDAEREPLRGALVGLREGASSMRVLGSFDAGTAQD